MDQLLRTSPGATSAGVVELGGRHTEARRVEAHRPPLAEVAISLRRGTSGNKAPEAVRIILGAVAPVPYRARTAETMLLQSPSLDAERIRKIGQAALSGATPLSRNGYKLPLVSGLVQQAIADLLI